MYNTFNMGAGLVLAVAAEDASRAVAAISAAGETAFVIGECTGRRRKGRRASITGENGRFAARFPSKRAVFSTTVRKILENTND